MKIKVNGEEKKIELDQENALLSTALNLMGYKPNTIVVELNNLIINKFIQLFIYCFLNRQETTNVFPSPFSVYQN